MVETQSTMEPRKPKIRKWDGKDFRKSHLNCNQHNLLLTIVCGGIRSILAWADVSSYCCKVKIVGGDMVTLGMSNSFLLRVTLKRNGNCLPRGLFRNDSGVQLEDHTTPIGKPTTYLQCVLRRPLTSTTLASKSGKIYQAWLLRF